jgi:hypothetical protein
MRGVRMRMHWRLGGGTGHWHARMDPLSLERPAGAIDVRPTRSRLRRARCPHVHDPAPSPEPATVRWGESDSGHSQLREAWRLELRHPKCRSGCPECQCGDAEQKYFRDPCYCHGYPGITALRATLFSLHLADMPL